MSYRLSDFVSNTDKNVYTIYNLPEEVIAVIFAYVSRSPKSFRENLQILLEKEEILAQPGNQLLLSDTARRFHERWVVGYGHSSVAEHAVAHVGIEKISRLASAELELANRFNSFTEYSQRYQRPRRGDFYIPDEIRRHPQIHDAYVRFQHEAYDAYETILARLIPYLTDKFPKQEHETQKAHETRIEKLAFEDARYVLTLATLTNLGMTGNGRALRDTLVVLLSSPYPECVQLAKDMETEISRVLPTLLRHVKPSDHLLQCHRQLSQDPFPDGQKTVENEAKKEAGSHENCSATRSAGEQDVHKPRIRLADYETVLNELCAGLFFSYRHLSYEEAQRLAQSLSVAQKEETMQTALDTLGPFENPHPAFEQVRLKLFFTVSEANWHQLLRHNRRTAFVFQPPNPDGGITVPPHVEEAGLAPVVQQMAEKAEKLYRQIEAISPAAAHYCVTNAHRRQIVADLSLWELYHLINLRTSQEAQWDIRETFAHIHAQLSKTHPVIARFAKRRP